MIQNLWENKTMYREFPGPVVRTPCWGPKKKKKKNYGIQQKQFKERSSQRCKSTSGNKKNLKQPKFTHKGSRKKNKVSRRKEIIKIREEINETEV